MLFTRYFLKIFLLFFILAAALLAVVILVQQSSRQTDVIFAANVSGAVVRQIFLSLLPGVLAIVFPLAALTAVIVGLGQLQGDSELVVMQSLGMSKTRMLLPVLAFGLVVTLCSLFINIAVVPYASKVLRQTLLNAALEKLQSPIEPNTFYSEIPNFVIYIENADTDKGIWKNIFIFNNSEKSKRLITARSGRLDVSEEKTEMFLADVSITTLPFEPLKAEDQIASENLNSLRLVLPEKQREKIIAQIKNQTETQPEELGLIEIAKFARQSQGNERTDAYILFFRRLSNSFAPLILSFLGFSLALRFGSNRGRNFLLIIATLIIYYLLTLIGEQLVRSGTTGQIYFGGLLASITAVVVGTAYFMSNKSNTNARAGFRLKLLKSSKERYNETFLLKTRFADTLGFLKISLLNRDIVSSCLIYTVGFGVGIVSFYYLFTILELWKFVRVQPQGVSLLIRYLLTLIPFVTSQLLTTTVFLGCLTAFVIKSRARELTAWHSTGQSSRRIVAPLTIILLVLGGMLWLAKSEFIPHSNARQDDFRARLKNSGQVARKNNRLWIKDENRIILCASDNENDLAGNDLSNFRFYEMELSKNSAYQPDAFKIQSISRAERCFVRKDSIELEGISEKYSISTSDTPLIASKPQKLPSPRITVSPELEGSLALRKVSHLTNEELEVLSKREDSRIFKTELLQRHTTVLEMVFAGLLGVVWVLLFRRQNALSASGFAIVAWLIFLSASSYSRQLGNADIISPVIAVWFVPLFAMLATVFTLFKAKS